MINKCPAKALTSAIGIAVLLVCGFLSPMAFAQNNSAPKNLSFDGLEQDSEPQKKVAPTPRSRKADNAKARNDAAEGDLIADRSENSDSAQRASIPSIEKLMEAKLDALIKKQEEQEAVIALAEQEILQEKSVEKSIFNNNAYLSLSVINSAPPSEYRLDRTEIYLDGSRRPVAIGGRNNNGLPRNKLIFLGPLPPGCHEVSIEATYVRLKNDLISRFKGINRVEKINKRAAFVARAGYRSEIEIEGFEQANTFANLYRGPAIRFNRSESPNFLPGAPIVSMDDVLKQGRVKIDYVTEDDSSHRLLEKSLSIDGLPILVAESHNGANEGNVVFDAPLSPGKHTLNVMLLFGEQKRVEGGPMYNFRLKFDRDFYVISGQTTVVNLTGMPKDGFRSSPEDSRVARASSQIISESFKEFYVDTTCKELAAQLAAAEKEAQAKAEKSAPVVTEESKSAAPEDLPAGENEVAPENNQEVSNPPETKE